MQGSQFQRPRTEVYFQASSRSRENRVNGPSVKASDFSVGCQLSRRIRSARINYMKREQHSVFDGHKPQSYRTRCYLRTLLYSLSCAGCVPYWIHDRRWMTATDSYCRRLDEADFLQGADVLTLASSVHNFLSSFFSSTTLSPRSITSLGWTLINLIPAFPMALLPRQDKDTAISATSETAFRSGGIKLRAADIALICTVSSLSWS